MRGIAYGVGVGPGDPELMTLKAMRLIRENEVIAVPGSPIARLFGERFLVNSIHHQACRTLGRGLVCDGTCAQDGIIEAFRHESMPWYGVQFHPEMMAGTPDDGPAGDFLPLFMAFVNEVRKDAARRASSAR